MPQYPYTDTEVRIFSDLSHGPAVRVIRDGEPVEVAPEDAGSTVVLHPGDVLETDEPLGFFHAFLEGSVHPEPAAPPEAPAPVETPAPQPVPRQPRRRSTGTDSGNDSGSDTGAGGDPRTDDAPTA